MNLGAPTDHPQPQKRLPYFRWRRTQCRPVSTCAATAARKARAAQTHAASPKACACLPPTAGRPRCQAVPVGGAAWSLHF
jgi:hypothetical protein